MGVKITGEKYLKLPRAVYLKKGFQKNPSKLREKNLAEVYQNKCVNGIFKKL